MAAAVPLVTVDAAPLVTADHHEPLLATHSNFFDFSFSIIKINMLELHKLDSNYYQGYWNRLEPLNRCINSTAGGQVWWLGGGCSWALIFNLINNIKKNLIEKSSVI